jgi:hypothetical protein
MPVEHDLRDQCDAIVPGIANALVDCRNRVVSAPSKNPW